MIDQPGMGESYKIPRRLKGAFEILPMNGISAGGSISFQSPCPPGTSTVVIWIQERSSLFHLSFYSFSGFQQAWLSFLTIPGPPFTQETTEETTKAQRSLSLSIKMNSGVFHSQRNLTKSVFPGSLSAVVDSPQAQQKTDSVCKMPTRKVSLAF